MPRLLFAWFLLLSYLLVVGAGLRVGRPQPAFSVDRPYVHSPQCQRANLLRLDCFEHCNGNQQQTLRQLPAESGWHFLAQFKGLDVHCLASGLGSTPVAGHQWRPAPVRAPLPTPAVRVGGGDCPLRPPCRG